MTLLTGCLSEQPKLVINANLKPPPTGAVKALATQCKVKKDLDTCVWIVDLEKYYQKQDVVN
jgi:hypothetical protein